MDAVNRLLVAAACQLLAALTGNHDGALFCPTRLVRLDQRSTAAGSKMCRGGACVGEGLRDEEGSVGLDHAEVRDQLPSTHSSQQLETGAMPCSSSPLT